MRVRYTRTALVELEDILSSAARNNPVAAHDIGAEIEKVIARLTDFPLSAVSTDIRGVRVALVHRYPYLVFYEVDGEVLVIRNIRHAARQRPRE